MKRKAIIFILLILAIVAASAQTALEFAEVTPKDARTMGMGGTFHVFSQGYSSFLETQRDLRVQTIRLLSPI